MTIINPSEPFQQTEGSLRPEQWAKIFRDFYMVCLRRVPGARLSSMDLAAAYNSWSAAAGHRPISQKRTAGIMARLGHRRQHSNGTFYRDVGLALDYPHIGAELPTGDLAEANAAISMMREAVERIDQAMSQLSVLRASLDLCLPSMPRPSLQTLSAEQRGGAR